MLVDIPDDMIDMVTSAVDRCIEWFRYDAGHPDEDVVSLRAAADRLSLLSDGIKRRRVDLTPTPEVRAETLTEDAVGRLMVQAASVPDAVLRTRCIIWLDYPTSRSVHGPDIAAEINRRAKDGRRG